MLSNKQKEKLLANWGERADSMACAAEVRVYDPLSPWECYIYAMNPQDEDEISCIINGFAVELAQWTLSELSTRFNAEGEPVEVDHEYRPRRACEMFRILSEKARR